MIIRANRADPRHSQFVGHGTRGSDPPHKQAILILVIASYCCFGKSHFLPSAPGESNGSDIGCIY